MKKIKFGLFVMFMMLLPGFVYADTVSVSCPSSVSTGGTLTCTISANVTEAIYSYEIGLSLPTGFSILGDKINFPSGNPDDWQGGTNISSNGKIESYTGSAGPGSITLGTLSIVVGNDSTIGTNTISLSNIEFTRFGSDEVVRPSGDSATVTVTSSGGTPTTSEGLKSLSASVGVLAPMFSSQHDSYILTLPAGTETFALIAEAYDESAVITYTNVDTGEALTPSSISFITNDKTSMLIRIKVNNESREYSVTVNRNNSPTVGKAELASLTVGGKTVALVSGKYDYEVTLDDVSSYQVVATLEDSVNFKFNDYLVPPFTGTGEQDYAITIDPIVAGEGSNTYKISVRKAGGSVTPNPTPASSSQYTPVTPTNPTTGSSFVIFTIAVMLVAFGVSYYLYKQNLSKDN